MLTILADECKPREPSDYDRTVCAKISDTTLDSILHRRLYRIIKRCIIHGPCGVAKKELFACEVVHVLINFLRNSLIQLLPPPKMVTHYTDVETNHSRAVEVGGIKLDNRWVVPYNPYLLLKYNAHINVEI